MSDNRKARQGFAEVAKKSQVENDVPLNSHPSVHTEVHVPAAEFV